jgi:SH3-like domain-containing protein
LRGYTLASGVLFVVLAACTGTALNQHLTVNRAVVIAPEAVVRVGPLDEAKEMHQFRDGTEVELLERKEIATGSTNQLWLQVEDASGRTGWLKSETILRLD